MVAYMDHKDLTVTDISAERVQQITDNVHATFDRLAEATSRAGREPGSVRLLAATKTQNIGEIMAAIRAGIRLIGENRPQEITAKIDGLQNACAALGYQLGLRDVAEEGDGSDGTDKSGEAVQTSTGAQGSTDMPLIPLHLIGQLQSNKINKILPYVNVIESADSESLAQKIARRAVARNMTAHVLLEVNESGEESKSGCAPEQARDLAELIGSMDGLALDGLMTVGAHVDDETVIRRGFTHLRELRDELVSSGETGTENCRELSMGMSGDAAIAIEEGSTQVRLGRAIFGERLFV